jgi:hypothetical protein
MGHKVYISFKVEDVEFKSAIQKLPNLDIIDKTLNTPIDSSNEDYIMQKIRSDYLSNSTVTIFLIGLQSAENLGWSEQRYIKRELQGSLYNSSANTKNGILGIVLPAAQPQIYLGKTTCWKCGESHDGIGLTDSTSIKEFNYNFFIPNEKCCWNDDDRYCILAKWEEFIASPEAYIEAAFLKREAPIASKTKVYLV